VKERQKDWETKGQICEEMERRREKDREMKDTDICRDGEMERRRSVKTEKMKEVEMVRRT
jgi:hypothetical protein